MCTKIQPSAVFLSVYFQKERVVIKSEWVMTRVRYFLRFCWFYVGLSDQCAHALETRWMNARQQLTQGRGPSIKYVSTFFAIYDTPLVHFTAFLYLSVLTFLAPLPLKSADVLYGWPQGVKFKFRPAMRS